MILSSLVRRPSGEAAPIAILDFLAAAEVSVARLGAGTPVRDWIVVREHGDEQVVLAGQGDHGLRPGDAFDGAVVEAVTYPLLGPSGPFGAVCALPATPTEAIALRSVEPMVHVVVDLLGSVLALDLDRSRLQRRLDDAESTALSDPLTELGNRSAFDRALAREEARCVRFGHLAGVVVLDLDGLKEVNDTHGHGAGDALIRRASRTLIANLRDSDQAFRTGGDEFAVLLPEIHRDGVAALCERIERTLAEDSVAASIGGATRGPGDDLHAVARDADRQMYEHKRARARRR